MPLKNGCAIEIRRFGVWLRGSLRQSNGDMRGEIRDRKWNLTQRHVSEQNNAIRLLRQHSNKACIQGMRSFAVMAEHIEIVENAS
jgi:hypothetical protein